ncbi:MAG: hypothetical protein L3J66_07105 [Bacteroidales bacterium]|nr:hypothetical protein [Bacteroidales bacterium]
MEQDKKIEILNKQIQKLDDPDFDHHNWYTETGNRLKLIFEDADDRIHQLKSPMHRPEYMLSGIVVEKLIKDWKRLLEGYKEELDLLGEEMPEIETIENGNFIDSERILELTKITSDEFDFSKLIALSQELNWNYSNGNYLTVSMLSRAIIDHIPPIFGMGKFNEVANNCGGKSFKKNMLNLNNSLRNIADNYLHQTIRNSEILPNKTQIDFKNDFDVLFAEIIRIFK